MRTLRIISGVYAGQNREIDGELVLGREDADVALSDAEVSRRHAAFRPVSDGVEVEDLGSRNGTFVNEQRVQDKVTLTSSAIVRVGQTQLRIDIAVPQATTLHGTDAPSDRPMLSPDVTVQRPVLSPDVTVQRPVASPEVTARRPVVSPELTAKRPVPPQPSSSSPPGGRAGPIAAGGPPRSIKSWLPWIFGGLILAVAIAVVLSLILK